jgi:chemotaxis protein methyltransferase CheR
MAKEFTFTRNDFEHIRAIVSANTGISLGDNKFEMVYGRLARRLRALGLTKVSDYLTYIGQESDEYIQFINAVTTNLTYFFREGHHFDFIKNTVLSELEVKHRKDRRVRFWSAGCSSGEEPYSLAATVHPFVKKYSSWDVKILATDLDTQVLAKAKQGYYEQDRLDKLDEQKKKALFENTTAPFRIRQELKNIVYFKRLNLIESWPMKGMFDLIMCRNVLIYFNKETQAKLIQRFINQLHPGGYLILGHSESIPRQMNQLVSVGRTTYRKEV